MTTEQYLKAMPIISNIKGLKSDIDRISEATTINKLGESLNFIREDITQIDIEAIKTDVLRQINEKISNLESDLSLI
jgi:hypothetical protein